MTYLKTFNLCGHFMLQNVPLYDSQLIDLLKIESADFTVILLKSASHAIGQAVRGDIKLSDL